MSIFDEKALEQRIREIVQAEINNVSKPEPARLSLVEPLVGVSQAAKHLDISERKLRQMIADKKVPFRRVDGGVKFKLSELDEWSAAA